MSAPQHLRAHLNSLNAFDRHKFLLHDLATHYGAAPSAPAPAPMPKTDAQLLKEAYQYVVVAASKVFGWSTLCTPFPLWRAITSVNHQVSARS